MPRGEKISKTWIEILENKQVHTFLETVPKEKNPGNISRRVRPNLNPAKSPNINPAIVVNITQKMLEIWT